MAKILVQGRPMIDILRIAVTGNSAWPGCILQPAEPSQVYGDAYGVLLVASSVNTPFLIFDGVAGCLQLVYG